MSIFTPFNNQPTSVSVKTSSYTIPAGSYARVQVQVINGGTFTIDGTTVLQSLTAVAGDLNVVATSRSSSGTMHTVTSGYRFEGQYIGATSSEYLTIDGIVASTTGTATHNIKASEGQVLAHATGGAGFGYLTGYELREHKSATHAEIDLWIPTGTVINGTGDWVAVVSLFNEIT